MPRNTTIKSMREAARYAAIDENGILHTVVERVEVGTPASFGIYRTGALTGLASYYSMTTGDILDKLTDGSYQVRNSARVLRRTEVRTTGPTIAEPDGDARS